MDNHSSAYSNLNDNLIVILCQFNEDAAKNVFSLITFANFWVHVPQVKDFLNQYRIFTIGVSFFQYFFFLIILPSYYIQMFV